MFPLLLCLKLCILQGEVYINFMQNQRRMRNRLVLVFLMLVIFKAGFSQKKMSREEYVETYAEIAMEEMRRTGIPASITLAQGCLESDNGNSRLAKQARNHFGIKCHDWDGKKIFHDDDEKDECFRVYRTDEESYDDHSDFLTTKNRYKSLFELDQDDYKGWARGLKKAGYATSRKYADLIIHIIEENELYVYDAMVLNGENKSKRKKGKMAERLDIEPVGDTYNTEREVFTNNRIEYIIAEKGDTWKGLREEFDMFKNELYRYNNVEKSSVPDSGMIVYLQPKRWKAEKGNEQHIMKEEESMWSVSQKYGVKLNCLFRRNGIEPGTEPEAGSILWLRKKKPSDQINTIKEKKSDEKEAPVKLEFSDF